MVAKVISRWDQMASKTFSVDGLRDLLVMQRVFREAKFCVAPDDQEISGSPIVAELFNRLMDALISTDVDRYGEEAKQRWAEWLTLDESRYEWRAALGRAKVEPEWSRWTEEERHDYVKDLLSPFIVSSELLKRFIEIVENGAS